MAANGKEAEGGVPKLEKVLTTKASGHTERRDEFKESEGLTTAGEEEEPSHLASPPAPATRESRASARAFRLATIPRRHRARHRAQIRSRRRPTLA